jgi:SAM-dependent methyltransferase
MKRADIAYATQSQLRPIEAGELDYIDRNRAAWDRWAPGHIAAGRRAWQDEDLRWGLWGVPESELALLEGIELGGDAIELGCGTAAVSAWLARKGLRPVAVDISSKQLETAEGLQRQFGVAFPLVSGNAESILFDDGSFDVAISEYGASLWCDPRRWVPEAQRLLRPEGRLIFFTNSCFLLTCTSLDGEFAGDRLMRDYFDRFRIEFDLDGAVEFHLTHGHWIRLLRQHGFVVDDLIEVRPPPRAKPRVGIVTSDWARQWPSEEIWVARRVGDGAH